MVKLEFLKVSNAGNDFIVFDNRKNIFDIEHQKDLVERMCARKYGIGADGICFIESSDIADYRVRVFFPNGVESCFNSNGIRTAIRFASEKNIAGNTQEIDTSAGIVKGEVEDELVKISIPEIQILNTKFEIEIPHNFENKIIKVGYLHADFKHLMLKVEKANTFDAKNIGYMLANHNNFQPEGIDVAFYDIIDQHNINVIGFSKNNNGLVNSSGNSVIAAFLLANKNTEVSNKVIAHTLGGLYRIQNNKENTVLEGEARITFNGFITSDMLNFDIEKIRKKQFF